MQSDVHDIKALKLETQILTPRDTKTVQCFFNTWLPLSVARRVAELLDPDWVSRVGVGWRSSRVMDSSGAKGMTWA